MSSLLSNTRVVEGTIPAGVLERDAAERALMMEIEMGIVPSTAEPITTTVEPVLEVPVTDPATTRKRKGKVIPAAPATQPVVQIVEKVVEKVVSVPASLEDTIQDNLSVQVDFGAVKLTVKAVSLTISDTSAMLVLKTRTKDRLNVAPGASCTLSDGYGSTRCSFMEEVLLTDLNVSVLIFIKDNDDE